MPLPNQSYLIESCVFRVIVGSDFRG